MIARLWHGATLETDADPYLAYLRESGVKECLATPGNRGVFVLRKGGTDRTDFLFISLWAALDDIRRFASADLKRAVYYPRDSAFLLDLEPEVQHYELFEFRPGAR